MCYNYGNIALSKYPRPAKNQQQNPKQLKQAFDSKKLDVAGFARSTKSGLAKKLTNLDYLKNKCTTNHHGYTYKELCIDLIDVPAKSWTSWVYLAHVDKFSSWLPGTFKSVPITGATSLDIFRCAKFVTFSLVRQRKTKEMRYADIIHRFSYEFASKMYFLSDNPMKLWYLREVNRSLLQEICYIDRSFEPVLEYFLKWNKVLDRKVHERKLVGLNTIWDSV